jgi:hypothetical protein
MKPGFFTPRFVILQGANSKWPMFQINNGRRRLQPPAPVDELRVFLVVLYLIRENLAIEGETCGL